MVSNTTSFGLDYLHEFLDPCQNKSHYCGILYTAFLEMQNLKQSGISIVVVQEKYHTWPCRKSPKRKHFLFLHSSFYLITTTVAKINLGKGGYLNFRL